MTTVPSATTWGLPTSTKHALLIHGLTSSSHTWHRVATSLAEQGYFVTAPNLIGHVCRAAADYHINIIAEDLRPYLEARTYDLVMGHSLGGVTVLHLLPYLPGGHPTAIVLVDPPLNIAPAELDVWQDGFMKGYTEHESSEELCAKNALWTHEDGTYRALATRLCPPETFIGILTVNRPCNFLSRFEDVSDAWKVSILLADQANVEFSLVRDLEPYLHVRQVVVPDAGHWIQSEFPDAIVKEALDRVAELGGGLKA